MRGAVPYAPGDIRVEDREDPRILAPTDVIIRLPATCICGSDLWPYRGLDAVEEPFPIGHEYVGVVEEVGSQVRSIRPGQFVVGSFFASDNTRELCQAGYQSSCVNKEPIGANGAQAEDLFYSLVHLHGGPAPVRRFLSELIDLIWNRRIDPGKVFDLTLPLEQAAEGCKAMGQRRAIKTLLRP
jgi:threonine dehydrogenase-like Zn-dependent dehydrogenase